MRRGSGFRVRGKSAARGIHTAWRRSPSLQAPLPLREGPGEGARHRRRPDRRGFTLMELMVAIVILGVVVTTVLASFNMVFSSAETLEGSAAAFEMGQTSVGRIVTDLENLFVLERPFYKQPAIDGPPDLYRFEASLDSLGGTKIAKLRFTSRAHVPLNAPAREGIAEIVYYLQAMPDGGLRLKRADHLPPYPRFEERSTDPVLCENVKSLAIEYVDASGKVTDTWDSESARFDYATPEMVAVRIEVSDGRDAFVFQTAVRLPTARRKAG
jgi:general secretion pathway protein J